MSQHPHCSTTARLPAQPGYAWLALFLLSLLLAACAGVPAVAPTAGVTAQPEPLHFVEYREDGGYADPAQLESLRSQIGTQGESGLILVGFVHGWQDDARPDSPIVADFRRLLQAIAANEAQQAAAAGRAARQLAGVYLGWPGTAAGLPGLSFHDRRRVAAQVAMGALGDTLLQLKTLRDRAGGDSELILVGHSLGAAMLYQRLVQTPLHDAADPAGTLADRVLLLSPAIPASAHAALARMTPAERTRLPQIITVTSEEDRTLRMAFPLGQWFDGVRAAVQGEGALTALGLHAPLVTHRLDAAGQSAVTLLPVGDARNSTGFFQIAASREVMAGHKDIGNPRLLRFIAGLDQRPLSDTPAAASRPDAFVAGVQP